MSKRCPRVAFADTEVVVHKTHPPARLQRTTVKQRGEKPLKTVKGQGEGSLAEKKTGWRKTLQKEKDQNKVDSRRATVGAEGCGKNKYNKCWATKVLLNVPNEQKRASISENSGKEKYTKWEKRRGKKTAWANQRDTMPLWCSKHTWKKGEKKVFWGENSALVNIEKKKENKINLDLHEAKSGKKSKINCSSVLAEQSRQ